MRNRRRQAKASKWLPVKSVVFLLLLCGMGSLVYLQFFAAPDSADEATEESVEYVESIDEQKEAAYFEVGEEVNEDSIGYEKKRNEAGTMRVHASHYDYTEVAAKIVAGCETDYQRIKAIYSWMCKHIDYDTSFKIITADECFDKRKGVCQAYCELFYQIAKAAGVYVEIVSGQAKRQDGVIDRGGHAWLFAYTAPEKGILLDATWGAGYVNNGKFCRNENCWMWFNVNPEWMILSHFPDDASYQLTNVHATYEEFAKWYPANSLWLDYGLSGEQLAESVRANELSMPKFYVNGSGRLKLLKMPMCATLKVGRTYAFRVKMLKDEELALVNEDVFVKKSEWNDEGDGVYSIDFTVKEKGTVAFCMKKHGEARWDSLIEYAAKR